MLKSLLEEYARGLEGRAAEANHGRYRPNGGLQWRSLQDIPWEKIV